MIIKKKKIQYANNCFQQLGMGDPITYVYKFVYDEKDMDEKQITKYLIIHELVLCIKVDSYAAHIFMHGHSVII